MSVQCGNVSIPDRTRTLVRSGFLETIGFQLIRLVACETPLRNCFDSDGYYYPVDISCFSFDRFQQHHSIYLQFDISTTTLVPLFNSQFAAAGIQSFSFVNEINGSLVFFHLGRNSVDCQVEIQCHLTYQQGNVQERGEIFSSWLIVDNVVEYPGGCVQRSIATELGDVINNNRSSLFGVEGSLPTRPTWRLNDNSGNNSLVMSAGSWKCGCVENHSHIVLGTVQPSVDDLGRFLMCQLKREIVKYGQVDKTDSTQLLLA